MGDADFPGGDEENVFRQRYSIIFRSWKRHGICRSRQRWRNTIHIFGKVLEFKPHTVFAHTYNVGRAYAGDDPRYAESRITYSLEPIGACTKLKVIHDQWKEDDPSYENTANGWRLLLSNIKTLVETEKVLDLQGAAGHTGSGPAD